VVLMASMASMALLLAPSAPVVVWYRDLLDL
jgi:hypothetical protein